MTLWHDLNKTSRTIRDFIPFGRFNRVIVPQYLRYHYKKFILVIMNHRIVYTMWADLFIVSLFSLSSTTALFFLFCLPHTSQFISNFTGVSRKVETTNFVVTYTAVFQLLFYSGDGYLLFTFESINMLFLGFLNCFYIFSFSK